MNDIVMQIKNIELDGNVIDNGWIEKFRYANGKPRMNAIMILSEIYYWYRPTLIRDELTGKVLGYKKKFKADKLQKSYAALGERFGFTARQAKLACDYLKKQGLITIEFRAITSNNRKLNNVMFVELIPENLKKITGIDRKYEGEKEDTLLHSNVTPSYIPMQDPPTTGCKTNTKTTTKTTNNIYIPFEKIINYLNTKAGTNYKHTSKNTRQKIRARFDDGFNLEDFKTVVDKKCSEWLGDAEYEKYLRPETLFGNKFEGYLNQKVSKKKKVKTQVANAGAYKPI